MSMLPQPPPDVPPPPPGKPAMRSRRIWKAMWVCGLCSVGLVAAGVGLGVLRSRNHRGCCSGVSEAVTEARQIGLAMFEFETEYGDYPDTTTVAAVKAGTGSTWTLGGSTSNDFFRQLIAGNIAMSEGMFHLRTPGSPPPDNRYGTEAEALKKGECGFSYLRGAKAGDNSQRPLVVAPLVPGTRLFDPKVLDGKAVILRMDNSVVSLPIDKQGRVMIGGTDLMDPKNPVWGGKPPVIAWPDF